MESFNVVHRASTCSSVKEFSLLAFALARRCQKQSGQKTRGQKQSGMNGGGGGGGGTLNVHHVHALPPFGNRRHRVQNVHVPREPLALNDFTGCFLEPRHQASFSLSSSFVLTDQINPSHKNHHEWIQGIHVKRMDAEQIVHQKKQQRPKHSKEIIKWESH